MTVEQPYLWAEVARQTRILKIRATNIFMHQPTSHSLHTVCALDFERGSAK